MRHIILDTETTGLSAQDGHRLVEIGALEMVNFSLTGHKLHLYINPEREIDEGALAVHGLSSEFLSDKPVFADIADDFMQFIGSDMLVIHNAPFDMGFLNSELSRCDMPELSMHRVTDTLALARKKFPGAQASLDALCRRFQIDNSHRDLHGALIDADLLAAVFVELMGGRQPDLALQTHNQSESAPKETADIKADKLQGFEIIKKEPRKARPFSLTKDEIDAHAQLLDAMTDPIWRR